MEDCPIPLDSGHCKTNRPTHFNNQKLDLEYNTGLPDVLQRKVPNAFTNWSKFTIFLALRNSNLKNIDYNIYITTDR